MTDRNIYLARHREAQAYWQGGNFELNLSFDGLVQRQWQALIDHFWSLDHIEGPFERRYVPHYLPPPSTRIMYPEPTATYTQYGVILLEGQRVGMDVLVTRSLFECFSLMIPVGMFDRLKKTDDATTPFAYKDNPTCAVVDAVYKSMAVHLWRHVPFTIASIGWNRECQLVRELQIEDEQRERFFKLGNCLIVDDALRRLEYDPNDYEHALPGLRWLPPGDAST
jgi:hypothetical protein